MIGLHSLTACSPLSAFINVLSSGLLKPFLIRSSADPYFIKSRGQFYFLTMFKCSTTMDTNSYSFVPGESIHSHSTSMIPSTFVFLPFHCLCEIILSCIFSFSHLKYGHIKALLFSLLFNIFLGNLTHFYGFDYSIILCHQTFIIIPELYILKNLSHYI